MEVKDMENKFNFFYSLFITTIFLLTLNSLEGKKGTNVFKPACFNAPIYLYDERNKKYYRQDWCFIGDKPIYFDSIPVPTNGDIGNNFELTN